MTTTTATPIAGLVPAEHVPVRLRLMMYGDTGAGKTYSALEIASAIGGRIALLDPERGARLYARAFPHDCLPTDDILALDKAVRALGQGGHDYRTLIIDPISLLWSAWQEQWEAKYLARNAGRAGHRGEWYEMGMKDWGPIKRTWDAFLRRLISLDMNVIVTAREKAEYEGSGDNLRKIGETFDAEKRLAYWWDTVLRLQLTRAGSRLATTIKDRTGALPPAGKPWEWSSGAVVTAFEGAALGREVTRTLASEEILAQIRELAIELDLSTPDLNNGARHHYGAPTIEELTPEQAEGLVGKLRAKAARNNNEKEA